MTKRIFHLRSRSLSRSNTSSSFYRRHIVFSTNWTSDMDHVQIFTKNDGTNEDIHAADRVLVAHRYNSSDSPINANVARRKLYKNSASFSHSSPTEDASNLHSLCAYHNIQNGMGKP